MEPELRPLENSDLHQAFRLDRQAFNLPESRREHWVRWSRPERILGAFENGRLRAACRVWEFGQYFGGRPLPMGGVANVGVAPERRGTGLARRLLHEALRAMQGRGEVISALYPATTSLYRAAGYELAGNSTWVQVDAASLRGLAAPASHRVQPLESPEDFEAARRCYEAVAPGIDGWLARGDFRWGALRADWSQERYCYGCVDGRGQLEGYVVYRHERVPPGASGDYAIRVDELVAATPAALRALWRTLASSASLAHVITCMASPEDALVLLVPEQRALRVRAQLRWMLRVVDAPGAVAARGFAPGLDVEAPLRLRDALLPTNRGDWILRVRDGVGQLEKGGGSGAPQLGIGAFAALFSGYADTGRLARAGLLEGGGPEARRALDLAFAGPTPWMIDEF